MWIFPSLKKKKIKHCWRDRFEDNYQIQIPFQNTGASMKLSYPEHYAGKFWEAWFWDQDLWEANGRVCDGIKDRV